MKLFLSLKFSCMVCDLCGFYNKAEMEWRICKCVRESVCVCERERERMRMYM